MKHLRPKYVTDPGTGKVYPLPQGGADDGPEPEPPTPEPEPAPTPEPEPEPEPTDWKAEARKWEARAKENKDAATRLKELEDAQKSEEQRLKDRIAELETASLEAARLRVALRKGLTETQAKRLVGTTDEELEADADELLASFKTDNPEPEGSGRRPKERLRPGATPSTEPEETDPVKLAANLPRHF